MMGESIEAQQFSTNYKGIKRVPQIVPQPNL